MTEQEITLSEIRSGDTIRVETTQQDLEVSLIGTALSRDPFTNDWLTKAGLNLTTRSRPQKYVLLDRPKPPLPTAEDTVIWVTRVRDETKLTDDADIEKYAILDGEGDWVIVFPSGVEYFKPEHILTWYPVAIDILEEA